MIGSMVKLIDYGSARRISAKQGEVGEMVGTTEFMCKFVSLCACSFFYQKNPSCYLILLKYKENMESAIYITGCFKY